ncbi:hypothetical protein H4R33_001847, partial [Dimargaris cristalligena]
LVWLLAAEKGLGHPTYNPNTIDYDYMDLGQPSYSFNDPTADDYYRPNAPEEYSMSVLPHSQGGVWDPRDYSGITSFDEKSDLSDNSFLKGIVDGMHSDTEHNGHFEDSRVLPEAEYSFPMREFS